PDTTLAATPPDHLAGARVKGVEPPVERREVDTAVRDGRRKLEQRTAGKRPDAAKGWSKPNRGIEPESLAVEPVRRPVHALWRLPGRRLCRHELDRRRAADVPPLVLRPQDVTSHRAAAGRE